MGEYRQFIDGEWVDASDGGTWDVIDPATEEVVATVPFGTRADAETAIEAADRAFPAWSGATAYERAAVLRAASDLARQRLDELGHITSMESGKPLAQGKGEWVAAADLLDWYAEEAKRAYGRTIPARVAGKRMMVLRQPLGVVGTITAWNFPAYNVARAVAAALGAGCTVVSRPSELTPMTGMALAGLLEEAGIPPGVFNVINGDPDGMGQAMLDAEACRKVHFTGSVRVGKLLMDGASRTVTRLSLELGGNAPVLVLPDADLELVAAGAVTAKYRNAGQVCVSPQRFLVGGGRADEFVERVVPQVEKLRVGPGTDPDTEVGPMINARQRERLEGLVEDAAGQGATIAVGGGRPADRDKGFFFEPTVVADVAPELPLYREELFGPVMPVATFDDLDEAIALANDTPYGLAAYVWTNDLRSAVRAAEGLQFGMVGVNEWFPQSTEGPFTGWKQSGIGSESGHEGFEEYLETKLVAMGGI
jgi:succinate-semialdehyde dehydrogenase / glutarate-semialdehyde dehydrogenase